MTTLGIGLGINRGGSPRMRTWIPTDNPNCVAWWKFDSALDESLAPIPSDPSGLGVAAYRVPDLSGNDYHLDQATAVRRPTFQYFNGTDAAKGYALQFDGIDDDMIVPSLTSRYVKTVWFRLRAWNNPASTSGTIMQYGTIFTEMGAAGFAARDNTGVMGSWGNPNTQYGWNDGPIVAGNAKSPVDDMGILVAEVNYGITTAEHKVRINGAESTLTAPVGVGSTGSDFALTLPMQIGGRHLNSTGYARCAIQEVVLFNGIPSPSLRSQINRYMSH